MPPTNSNWALEAIAVFHKEWLTEMRSRHGLFTSFLFSLLAVFAMSLASFSSPPDPSTAAGMLAVTLVFSSIVAFPRTFIVEDEQGTFDLLRLAADPSAAFAGKALYNALLSLITATVLSVLFVNLTGVPVKDQALFYSGVLLASLALSGGVSICGAIVMGANNRWLLGASVSLPILLPQIFLGMGATRVAFGTGGIEGGWQCVIGLAGFSLALAAGGPLLANAAWNTSE